MHDVMIVGGGIVGLTLAALLSKNNLSVAVIESKTINAADNTITARVSAIHLTAVRLFQYLECWDLLAKTARAPLQAIHIWDYTQKTQLQFDAREMGEKNLGFIVNNNAIVDMLYRHLKKQSVVDFYCPHSPASIERSHQNIVLTLNDERKLSAQLLVGADGAHSWVRSHMTARVHTRPYYQNAIIAVIQSALPHHHCAYQKFLPSGPEALLPLHDCYHHALVFSSDDAMSEELIKKSPEDFAAVLTESFDFKYGDLKLISTRDSFPLTMRHASHYAEQNLALVGDAAHTIHPLAGLGVNLGLMDAACLSDVLLNASHVGELRILSRYTRWRMAQNTPVIAAMRGLKEVFEINSLPFNSVRNTAINTINQCSVLKNHLMRLATGQSKELPRFLQR